MNKTQLLIILFLFFLGSLLGWVLEVIFNKFNTPINPEHKWINPGFLKGPYLPIYGFGVIILYGISYFEKSLSIDNILVELLLIFILATLLMTVLELIGGIFFIKVMKIRIWDYSDEPFNYKGIICLKYSLLWGIVSVIYYFLINPYIVKAVSLFTDNIEFSLIVGIFYGFIIIDLFETMDIVARLRKFARDNELVIAYEKFKMYVYHANKYSTMALFKSPQYKDISEYLKQVEKENREKKDTSH